MKGLDLKEIGVFKKVIYVFLAQPIEACMTPRIHSWMGVHENEKMAKCGKDSTSPTKSRR